MVNMWVVLALAASIALPASSQLSLDWWRTAVFYQVYPRSYQDSDGDGIGDLNGITEKLDHLVNAGVGAVWLSPIYKSPMVDFGYDIADFTEVDPIFGTLDDFDKLQARAKELGLKVILDFVPNHTSNESEWFINSVKKIEPYTDYYVWVDPKFDEDGNRVPPNNWLSAFGGSAWEWREERQQYYLHQFVVQQPDLNYRNTDVVEEMKNVLRYWLGLGVDGFRVDAVPYLFEDTDLTDEPLSGDQDALPTEANYLNHIYTQNLRETYDMIQQWREVVDEITAQTRETKILMLETYAPLEKVMEYYGTQERPGGHFPFNFLLIEELNINSTAYDFQNSVGEWMTNMPSWGWPNWVIGNHDQKRVATRFGIEKADIMNMLSLLLPGSGITYNGDEIGMVDEYISYEDTVDPAGRNAGPDRYQLFSRDPCRTPFQWDNTTSAGFSTNPKTWLPVNPNYLTLNLQAEIDADKSHYKVYQKAVAARALPAFQAGSLVTYTPSEEIFAFSRILQGYPPFLVVMNLGDEMEHISLAVEAFESIPIDLVVYMASSSDKEEGSDVSTNDIYLNPKEVLVLTTP